MAKQIRPATEENKRIVEEVVRTGLLSGIVAKITRNSTDENLNDLMGDVLFSLLLDDKLPGIYERNQLNFYIARIIMNNVASKTSGYYRTYIKPGKFNNEDKLYDDKTIYEQGLYENPGY